MATTLAESATLTPQSKPTNATDTPPEIAFPSAPVEKPRTGEQLNAALRLLRTEVQDLQTLVFEKVRTGATTLAEQSAYIKKTVSDISKLVREIEDWDDDDSVRHVLNVWEDMSRSPLLTLATPPAAALGQEQLHQLALLQEQVKEISFTVGCLTIPHRINDWLKKVPPGHYLPFHLLVRDELPDEQDRTYVLNMMAWAPDAMKSALIDPVRGLVYRFEPNAKKRVHALFWICCLLLGLSGAVWYAGHTRVLGMPPSAQMLALWASTLIGVFVHNIISGVKRSQATGQPGGLPLNELSKYVSARQSDFTSKLLTSCIALFGAVISQPNQITVSSAFLVGYGLDSVLEVFGASLEQRAATQASALREQLQPKLEKAS